MITRVRDRRVARVPQIQFRALIIGQFVKVKKKRGDSVYRQH